MSLTLFNILDSSAKSECLVYSQTPSGNKSDVVIGVWPGLESTGIRKRAANNEDSGKSRKDLRQHKVTASPKK